MIQINNRSIIGIHRGTREVISVYKGSRLIWIKKTKEIEENEILSCFSNGYWIDEYPWVDDLLWND